MLTKADRDQSQQATDWDRYYLSVPFTAKLTRRCSAAMLVDAIKRHGAPAAADGRLSIVEIGGANSCFVDRILAAIQCQTYHVVDNNRYGLDLLAKRAGRREAVRLHRQSVLDLQMDVEADLVFSVGLVEHFDPAGTRRAVLSHFDVLRPGGIAIILFPAPTLLYRLARAAIAAMGAWKFPDERPLKPAEVLGVASERGEILERKTLWPLILTQEMIIARKAPASGPLPAGRRG